MAMGEVYVDLERFRIEGGLTGLTSREADVLLRCRANCVRDFTLGLSGGAMVTWLASKNLHNALRVILTAEAGFSLGMWLFQKSADNCVQRILSLEGTRLQKELGKLMLKKYPDNPLIMQRVSNHFTSEEVYNDTSDQPRLRWRYRNFYADSYTETSEQKGTGLRRSETYDQKRINEDRKQEQMNAVVDAMENPFDCIFGLPESADEIPHSDMSSKSPTRPVRGNKRSHRRHRKRQQEAADHA